MSVTVNWHPQVPLPTFAGYAFRPRPNIIRTEVEVGPAIQRRRSRRSTDDVAVTLELTAWEMAIFEAWAEEEALEGAVWFNVTLIGGVGLGTCEARLKGGAETVYAARNGARWSVRTTLEVRARPKLSAVDLALIGNEQPDPLFASIASFHAAIAAPPLWASGMDFYLIVGEVMPYLFDQVAALHGAMTPSLLWLSGDDLWLEHLYGEDPPYLFDQVAALDGVMAPSQLWIN